MILALVEAEGDFNVKGHDFNCLKAAWAKSKRNKNIRIKIIIAHMRKGK